MIKRTRKPFTPYKITHVQIAGETALSSLLLGDTGHYLILWWLDYPLGHLFIGPLEPISEANLLEKIYGAIQPALVHYQNKFARKENSKPPAPSSFEIIRAEVADIFQSIGSRPDNEIDVSVIICTRDRPEELVLTLDSLLRMRVQAKEIIVVDNAPADERTREAVENFPSVKYVCEPRAGLDIARNKGIASSSCPIVAYVDDDVRVHPLWACQLARAFSDSSVTAVTGLVFASELETKAQFLFETYWSFNRGFVETRYTPAFLDSNKKPPSVWKIGAGANMAFRRSVFAAAGLFDERLDAGAAGCSGDSEMWFRILACGGQIVYDPLPVVYHRHRTDMKQFKRQIFNYMRGFTAAALIQHKQKPEAGYRAHLIKTLPVKFFRNGLRAFPRFRGRQATYFQEAMGILSGFLYYRRNRLPRSLPPR